MRILYVLHSDGQLILHIGHNLGIGAKVIITLEWPRGIATTFGFMPACDAIVAKAQRKPWKVNVNISNSLINNRNFSVRVPSSNIDSNVVIECEISLNPYTPERGPQPRLK